MKKLSILLIGLSIGWTATAQITLWDELAKAKKAETIASTDSLPSELVTSEELQCIEKDEIPAPCFTAMDDSVYHARLTDFLQSMDLSYNETVKICIDRYIYRLHKKVGEMLGLADYYFPTIEQTLASYNLPTELKYLAVVESALLPTAVSRAGACGLWQFMRPTGKSYNLEINNVVDERHDPIKSTRAACEYLQDLHAMYHDWNLAIASYNCGPGNVNKAIRKANGSRNFWDIYQYLPKETRTYVPLFIAANYVMNYYKEHNIEPVRNSLPDSTGTIMINQLMHFDQIASVMNLDKELLKALNPQYKQEIIPGNNKSYALLLPTADIPLFIKMADSIPRYRTEELFAQRVDQKVEKTSTRRKITYKVKSGENLYNIASRYGITAKQIQKWNRLKSNKVAKGRKLVLFIETNDVELASNTTYFDRKANKKTAVFDIRTNLKKNDIRYASKKENAALFRKYKVRSGDSFYSISKKYPGLTANELMKINSINNKSLKIGQIIKVPEV